MTCRLARRNSPQGILANNDGAERTRADPARGQLCVSCWEALGKWQQEIGSPVLDAKTQILAGVHFLLSLARTSPPKNSASHPSDLEWPSSLELACVLVELECRVAGGVWHWLQHKQLGSFPRLWGHRGLLALLSTLSMCQCGSSHVSKSEPCRSLATAPCVSNSRPPFSHL